MPLRSGVFTGCAQPNRSNDKCSIVRALRSREGLPSGLWAYQEGQMDQKMVCFGQLRSTRSRQDESMEVGEVGSKRPSLGCNGVHVVRWVGLIFRLLPPHSSWPHQRPDAVCAVREICWTQVLLRRPLESQRLFEGRMNISTIPNTTRTLPWLLASARR
jgi:hypothetical protein